MKKALTITDVEDAKKIAEIFESLDKVGQDGGVSFEV